ncbi:MAG: sigma-70 family RNA polymerase sigma factor [Planctomycetes bacterium]|nr:sigma-70 family RNA polymerase sigma factor [Planctomycetota bacterium]
MADPPVDLTVLLRRASKETAADAALLERVYDELRLIAGAQMRRESKDHTLQATALVNEAWLRLIGTDGEALPWENRAHFFGAAATAMRRILVDRARRVRSERHGGHMQRQALDGVDRAFDPDAFDFVAVDVALERFARQDPRAARIVELRFFAGLSIQDTARALDISERTVVREWNVARAWLARELQRDD